MTKNNLLILPSDKDYARRRIDFLQKEIEALGPEFNDAFSQTSETWHDNAPFEIVRDRQAMLYAEQQSLKNTLRASAPSIPKQSKNIIGIGCLVEVIDKNRKTTSYFVAGDWTPFAGKLLPNSKAIVVSRSSPIASCFIGLRENDAFVFNRIEYRISLISYDYMDIYAKLCLQP